MTSGDDLKAALRRVLASRFGIKVAIRDDSGLFSEGLIDSLNVMELVTFVEEQLGCPVPPAEITLENFDSIERIARFGERLLGQGGG